MAKSTKPRPPSKVRKDEVIRPNYNSSWGTVDWSGPGEKRNYGEALPRPIKPRVTAAGEALAPLAPGAIGTTPQDEPYYGYGKIPIIGNALEWGRASLGRILAPVEATDFLGQFFTGFTRPIGDLARGAGEVLNIGAQAVEQTMGALEGNKEAGEGSPLLDTSAEIERAFPQPSGRGFFSDLGRFARNFAVNLNPYLLTYNAIRMATSPLSMDEKRERILAGAEAGRIAYSAWVDPALREEFLRRYNAGEDPYLLQQELMRPGWEMVGQMTFDPLNLIGGWMGKTGTAGDALSGSTKLASAMSDVARATSEADKLDAAARAVPTIMDFFRTRGVAVTELSKKVGLLTGTAGAKRFVVSQQVTDFLQFVLYANAKDPEGGIELLSDLVKLGSANQDEVLEAFGRIAHDKAGFRVWLSDAGLDSAAVLRKVLEQSDGTVDAAKFLGDLSNKPLDEIVKIVRSRTDDAIERAFPTVTQRIRAGEKMSPAMRTLEIFDRVAQSKLYQPVNRFFAGIYMGLNPGYAFRNAMTNYLHMFADYGIGVFEKAPATRVAETGRWLGGVSSKILELGFSQVKGAAAGLETGLQGRLPIAKLAEWFERTGGEMVYGHVIEREMRRMLVPGRGLPRLEPLIEAGLDPRAAAYLGQLVVGNYGDVPAAVKAFRTAFGTGNIEAWRTLDWLSPRQTRLLESVPFGGRSVMAELQEAMAQADNPGAVKAIQDILGELSAEAAKVIKEGPMVTKGTDGSVRGTIGAIVRFFSDTKGVAPKEAEQLLLNIEQADHLVTIGYKEAFGKIPGGQDVIRAIDDIWAVANRNSDGIVKSATQEWDLMLDAAKGSGKTVSGSPEAQRLWNAFSEDILAEFSKARDEVIAASEAFAEQVRASGAPLDIDGMLAYARKAAQDSMDWHSATREGTDWVARRAVQPGSMADADMFKTIAANEKAAGELKAVYNAPMPGDVGPTGWATDAYGEALTRARGDASKIRVRYVAQGAGSEYEVGRAAAIADDLGRGQTINEGAYQYTKFDAEQGWLPAGSPPPGLEEIAKLVPPRNPEVAPSLSRVLHEIMPELKPQLEQLAADIGDRAGEVVSTFDNPTITKALASWADDAGSRVLEARMLAKQAADAGRKFTLLAYPEKMGYDIVAGYLFPYQFWYSRTYVNWMKRLANNPAILSHWAKYRGTLEHIHAGSPDWWKYNINTNELLGLDSENPLFFNLEATLNPLNGLSGVDFNDPAKREGWFATTLDYLGKFGPSTWTPFSIATAVGMYMKGEDEAAARWAGRLFPQTATIKSVLGLLRHKVSDLPLQGEYDPFVHLFSGGLDPYERRRVGRAIGWMVDQKMITSAEGLDAAHSQQGDVWNQALDMAVNQRAPGQLASFLMGVGFKARSQSDLQVDQFYADWSKLWTQESNLSPDEFKRSMDELRTTYPFMDAVLVSRKGGIERDRAYAYAVMGRIPPSMGDDFAEWAGIPGELWSKFYDTKGHIETWSETDRQRFVAGIVDIAAVVEAPTDATRAEYTEAKGNYSEMVDQLEQVFGKDISERIDAWYAVRDGTDAGYELADAMVRRDPGIQAAMEFKSQYILSDELLFKYYGSIGTIEQFYRGAMNREIENELGKEIWTTVDDYFDALAGAERRAFKAQHPEIGRYFDIRDQWAPMIDSAIVEFGSKLKDIPVDTRISEGVSAGQQDILGGIGNQGRGLPQMPWSEWEGILGPSLSRLVLDYSTSGDELPYSATSRLDDLANQMGIPSGGVLLQLAAQSAGSQ